MSRFLKALALAVVSAPLVSSQDDLGLDNGYLEFSLGSMNIELVKDAQVLSSLRPKGSTFDFLPRDKLEVRASNRQYHWGDLTFRYRMGGDSGDWIDGDTSVDRAAIEYDDGDDDALAAGNLTNTLPKGPLEIRRQWLDIEGDLGLRFHIKNNGDKSVELGSLGFPAEFNSIFTQRTAEEMRKFCSLSDPYIGLDAGQIRVTPVTGTDKSLLVTPLSNTTVSRFEAYRNLDELWKDSTWYGSQTFEGYYEWQVLSKAWAEEEWKNVDPWNEATSISLDSGEEITTGVRFTIADGIRDFDDTAKSVGVPVARSVPGFIVPRDQPASLWLRHGSPAKAFTVEPEGAVSVRPNHDNTSFTVEPSPDAWGRVRVSVRYEDGKVQTLHYFITKATTETLSDMGRFLTNEAYFDEPSDVFNRSPSVMTYDYEAGAIREQDSRAWIVGLSDEGGTGAYVAAVMKQVIQPRADEIKKLDAFVQEVVWGQIQKKDYGVVKSVFFYEPDLVPDYEYNRTFDWSSWTSWGKTEAGSFGRAYNYVHVTAAYWSLYRVARAYPDTVSKEWDWYLDQAQKTIIRMMDPAVGYNLVGLMGETVFGEVLKDLKREGKIEMADALEGDMRKRAEHWHSLESPFGSEMAWDSTGQEGVYYWTRHFGFEDSEVKTVNSVLGYTPNVPHWGWDGNARRYWDFVYGGKLQRIERQIHHYGSGLNGQVLLGAFRDDPSDTYLLRTGYAAISGPLSNINRDGFPSAAFHSWPDTLKWDGITGDYGGGFLGMALNGGTYIADDKDIGVVAYGGVACRSRSGTIKVTPKGAVRRRVFIGPLRMLIEVDAAMIETFRFNIEDATVSLTLGQDRDAPQSKETAIWLESFGSDIDWVVSGEGIKEGRGGWILELPGSGSVTVQLSS